MGHKAILFSSILLVSGAGWAGQSLLENAARQTARDTLQALSPNAIEKAELTSKRLEYARRLRESVENAPDAVKYRAQESVKASVKQSIQQATPEQLEAARDLKRRLETAPKNREEIEVMTKQKAAEKVLELLY
ncbi:hypothetical protein Q9L42_019390 [Methylomarinum sp. Ch1-1]|uniref:DUF4398 domain-containing protein n=1 Tax=Methylomarinum roseum TaxID=3067653 RepID=A0AAU7NU41_9GAMM|nr:hypothetical protein [Methylomarinum sp. Ch1-1]MDP4519441.1 hypothetical protein [Methylomarinum sp. Ch1-1]